MHCFQSVVKEFFLEGKQRNYFSIVKYFSVTNFEYDIDVGLKIGYKLIQKI